MTTSIKHASLNATLRGIVDDRYGSKVTHFRGIRYGNITKRFAKPEAVNDLASGTVDCTSFGPQCPQVHFDIAHLLLIPEDEAVAVRVPKDEFKCLNLNVSTPNDISLPIEDMLAAARKEQGEDVQWYRYLFDEPNPWQASSRAHHAVDLIMLFGGMDLAHFPHAEAVGQMYRRKWIEFVAGEEPWSRRERYAFGPFGKCGTVDDDEFSARRRTRALKMLREMTWAKYNPICVNVAAGKVSLIDM